jgi:hypothetical protein
MSGACWCVGILAPHLARCRRLRRSFAMFVADVPCMLQWSLPCAPALFHSVCKLFFCGFAQSATLFDACAAVAARRRGHGFLRQQFRCTRHFFVCKTNRRTNNTQAHARSTQLKCSTAICHTEQLLCEGQSATNSSADLKEWTLLLSMTVCRIAQKLQSWTKVASSKPKIS